MSLFKTFFHRSFLLLFVCMLGLQACTPSADTKKAKEVVDEFHVRFQAGDFEKIYQSTSDEVKKNTSKEDFVKILKDASIKLGDFKNTELKNSSTTDYAVGNSKITLTYKTEYALATVSEIFYFEKK